MNESELRDLLPDERPLPTGRRREMEERLMQQIEAEGKTSRRHFRLMVGAAAAIVVGVAALGVVVVGDDGDRGDGGDRSDPAASPDDRASTAPLVELVTVPRDVMTAVQDERNQATTWLLGIEDVLEIPVDDATTARGSTDTAVAGLRALADADPAGAAYGPALDDLDGLAAVRGDVDADDGPRNLSNTGPSQEVFDRYGQVLTGLLDAQAAFVATIDDPELRDGAEVYQLVLRQQELTTTLGREALLAMTSSLSTGSAEVADLSRLHELVRQGGDTLAAAADGTPYEEVTAAAVGELDASGFLPAVAGLLEDGTMNIPDMLDSMDSVVVGLAAAADEVEAGLTGTG